MFVYGSLGREDASCRCDQNTYCNS